MTRLSDYLRERGLGGPSRTETSGPREQTLREILSGRQASSQPSEDEVGIVRELIPHYDRTLEHIKSVRRTPEGKPLPISPEEEESMKDEAATETVRGAMGDFRAKRSIARREELARLQEEKSKIAGLEYTEDREKRGLEKLQTPLLKVLGAGEVVGRKVAGFVPFVGPAIMAGLPEAAGTPGEVAQREREEKLLSEPSGLKTAYDVTQALPAAPGLALSIPQAALRELARGLAGEKTSLRRMGEEAIAPLRGESLVSKAIQEKGGGETAQKVGFAAEQLALLGVGSKKVRQGLRRVAGVALPLGRRGSGVRSLRDLVKGEEGVASYEGPGGAPEMPESTRGGAIPPVEPTPRKAIRRPGEVGPEEIAVPPTVEGTIGEVKGTPRSMREQMEQRRLEAKGAEVPPTSAPLGYRLLRQIHGRVRELVEQGLPRDEALRVAHNEAAAGRLAPKEPLTEPGAVSPPLPLEPPDVIRGAMEQIQEQTAAGAAEKPIPSALRREMEFPEVPLGPQEIELAPAGPSRQNALEKLLAEQGAPKEAASVRGLIMGSKARVKEGEVLPSTIGPERQLENIRDLYNRGFTPDQVEQYNGTAQRLHNQGLSPEAAHEAAIEAVLGGRSIKAVKPGEAQAITERSAAGTASTRENTIRLFPEAEGLYRRGWTDRAVDEYAKWRSQGLPHDVAVDTATGNLADAPVEARTPEGRMVAEDLILETNRYRDMIRAAKTPPPEVQMEMGEFEPPAKDLRFKFREYLNLFLPKLRWINEGLFKKFIHTEDAYEMESTRTRESIDSAFKGTSPEERRIAGRLANDIPVSNLNEIDMVLANDARLRSASPAVRSVWKFWQQMRLGMFDRAVQAGHLRSAQFMADYLPHFGFFEVMRKVGADPTKFRGGRLTIEDVFRNIDKKYAKLTRNYGLPEIEKLKSLTREYLEKGEPERPWTDPATRSSSEVRNPHFLPRGASEVYALDLERAARIYMQRSLRTLHWNPLVEQWHTDALPKWSKRPESAKAVTAYLNRQIGQPYWEDMAFGGGSGQYASRFASALSKNISRALLSLRPIQLLKQASDTLHLNYLTGDPVRTPVAFGKANARLGKLLASADGRAALEELGLLHRGDLNMIEMAISGKTLAAKASKIAMSPLRLGDAYTRSVSYLTGLELGMDHAQAYDLANRAAGRYTKAALPLGLFTPVGRVAFQFTPYATITLDRLRHAFKQHGAAKTLGGIAITGAEIGALALALSKLGYSAEQALNIVGGGGVATPVVSLATGEDDAKEYVPIRWGPAIGAVEQFGRLFDNEQRAAAARKLFRTMVPGGSGMTEWMDALSTAMNGGVPMEQGAMRGADKELVDDYKDYLPLSTRKQGTGEILARAFLGYRTEEDEERRKLVKGARAAGAEKEDIRKKLLYALKHQDKALATEAFREMAEKFPSDIDREWLRGVVRGAIQPSPPTTTARALGGTTPAVEQRARQQQGIEQRPEFVMRDILRQKGGTGRRRLSDYLLERGLTR